MPNSITQASKIVPVLDIQFENEVQFKTTESALRKICAGPNGRRLIQSIEDATTNDKRITIIVNESEEDSSGLSGAMTEEMKTDYHGNKDPNSYEHRHKVYEYSSNGIGAKPLVFYNPNHSILVDINGMPRSANISNLAFIGLAHELVHAYYMMIGRGFGTEPSTSAINDPEHYREEIRAVGMGEFENTSLSENGIRRDHGLPLRNAYFE
ncbi:hypothetical protein F3J37_01605 [Pantoea sp. Al-1710]|uniref:Effector protein n=1 Tax=Candidatus Pantoea communis TaxID=2608354 RepID=A0ABX0RJU2_9GAMM|nr:MULTISPECIES: M91 family zinc metallopeptidase [Pantoea]NIG12925.1 hypothetical protein [Pantoea sp. Cy-640]NIG17374.1 hypothetical protein [Pantoea communis]